MDAKKYRLRTIGDILDLEPDVRARFISDLPYALDFYDLCGGDRPNDFYVDWTDDGTSRVGLHDAETGEELATLEVTDGKYNG